MIQNTHEQCKTEIRDYDGSDPQIGKIEQGYENPHLKHKRDHGVSHGDVHLVDSLEDTV